MYLLCISCTFQCISISPYTFLCMCIYRLMCNFSQSYVFLFKCIISLWLISHNFWGGFFVCFFEEKWKDFWSEKLKKRESIGPQMRNRTGYRKGRHFSCRICWDAYERKISKSQSISQPMLAVYGGEQD